MQAKSGSLLQIGHTTDASTQSHIHTRPRLLESHIKIKIGSLKHSILAYVRAYHLTQPKGDIPPHKLLKRQSAVLQPAMSSHLSITDIRPKNDS